MKHFVRFLRMDPIYLLLDRKIRAKHQIKSGHFIEPDGVGIHRELVVGFQGILMDLIAVANTDRFHIVVPSFFQ